MSYFSDKITKEYVEELLAKSSEMVFYDLETTGLSPVDDRIIEFSAIRYKIVNKSLMETTRTSVYIKPEKPLPEKITEITGYTDSFFVDKADETSAFEQIERFFEGVDAIAGYNNTTFDDCFISNLYNRQGSNFAMKYNIDVLKLVRQLIPKSEVENHKLATIANYLGVASDIDFHKAHDDVLATVRVFNALLPELMKDEEVEYPTSVPIIFSISFWEGYRGFSRIYVETDKGSVYFDIRQKNWQGKNIDPSEINMPFLVDKCYSLVGAKNEAEFAKFKGTWRISQ